MTKEEYFKLCRRGHIKPLVADKEAYTSEDLIAAYKNTEEIKGKPIRFILASAPIEYQKWVKEHIQQERTREEA